MMSSATTAREIRAYTRRASAGRRPVQSRRGFGDLYSYGLLALLAIIEAIGFVSAPARMSGTLASTAHPSVPPGGGDLDGNTVASSPVLALLLLAVFAWLYTIARSIGPIVVSRAQVNWWLSLPIARRGLIAPGFVFSLLTAVLVLIVVAFVVSVGAGGLTGVASVVMTVLAVAALGALVFGVAAMVQIRGVATVKTDAIVRLTASLALLVIVIAQVVAIATGQTVGTAAVPLGWVAWLPTGWPLAAATGAGWPAVALGVAALVVLGIVTMLLPRLSGHGLRQSAANLGELSTSVLSMASSSALSSNDAQTSKRRTRRSGRTRISSARINSAHGRFIVTQARVWLRIPGQLGRLVTYALLPAALVAVPLLNLRVIVLIALLICAFRAVTTASAVVRVMADFPALERLFALSEVRQRRLLVVVPAAILLLWCGGCFAAIALTGAAPVAVMLLALPVGIGLGGASVRVGYRPAPDWTAPSISTPAGALPSGWIYSAMYGRAAVVLVLLPALIAVAVGDVTALEIVVQVIISAAVIWWGTRVPPAIGGLRSLNPWSA